MSLTIRLLGRPQVVRDGSAVPGPRGRKTWGLLAYLLRAESRPVRETLAGLFFPEANDPLGALRWTLSEMRRLLGSPDAVSADPIELALPEGARVDVDVLIHGSWQDAIDLPGLGHPFLEGVNPNAGAALDLWLENQRRHVAAVTEGVLHEAALALLAQGDVVSALDLASRLAELNPLDENAQVVHVRCLAVAGHVERARRQVEACTQLFRRELAVEPTSALREAAEARPPASRPAGRAGALAQLEAGEAAVDAGAVSAGLAILQQAVADAEAAGAADLLARALVTLGSALVHAARGGDEEGAALLHRAIEVAAQDDDDTSVRAHRELGYVEFLRGWYGRAEARLARAAALAAPQSEELTWVRAVQGAVRTDIGHHAAALELLTEASHRAQAAGARRPEGWARSFLGRLHLLRDEGAQARTELTRAIDIARDENWNSFLPWPEALRAEVDVNDGALDRAARAFDHAFAMGCQLGDPCWESLAARGLGRVAAASGDIDRAIELLDDATRRCRRLPDYYRWVDAYGMAALAEVAVDAGAGSSRRWLTELEILTSRHGMRELVATAMILRARTGEIEALDTARLIASDVDNPALHARLAAAVSGT